MKNRSEIAEEKPASSPSTATPEQSSVENALAAQKPQASFEERRGNCPLCGSARISPFHTITRYTAHFTVDRCGDCGFIFMNPRFTEETVRGFYGEEYYRGSAEYSYQDERRAEKFHRHVWDARLAVIRKFIKAGRFLDVGAAFGGFLGSLSHNFEPAGIEPSEFAGNYARRRIGSLIHVGTLEDHFFPRDNFLVITMIEVLEHMADPVFALKECHRLLQKGGLLVIQTANMEGLQAQLRGSRYAYYMPGHLSYFSRRNLCALLKEVGFSRIKVYHPVEFGLLPKLKKSRGSFRSILDYRHWVRITIYHMLGKIHAGNFCVTSSMVVYAFK